MGRTRKSVSSAWLRWHASKLRAMIECPERAFLEFIMEEPKLLIPRNALGSACHYMFDRFYKPHKSTGRFPYATKRKLLSFWFTSWWSAVAASGATPDMQKPWLKFLEKNPKVKPPKPHGFGSWREKPETIDWQSVEDPDIHYRKGIGILSRFFDTHHERRHDGTPRWTERRFVFPWNGLTLSGIVDRIDFHADGAVLNDYKPSSQSLWEVDSGLQMTIYQLAWELYFRNQLRKNKLDPDLPLKAIRIYNYWSGSEQEIPIRHPYEVGLLSQALFECSWYFRCVLTGQPLPEAVENKLQLLPWSDVHTGNVSPRLPRGSHCMYCAHYAQCRSRELGQAGFGERPLTSRQLFAMKWGQQYAADHPTQVPISFPTIPLVRDSMRLADTLPQRRLSGQLTLGL